MIEHLPDPKTFLREVKKVLKSDGIFVVSTPNRLVHQDDNSPYHCQAYSPKEFEKLLRSIFNGVEVSSQYKSERAKRAIGYFMDSQKARENFVATDKIGLRKLIPKPLKEKIWKYLGVPFGRGGQESLGVGDFPIKKGASDQSEYILAVCRS